MDKVLKNDVHVIEKGPSIHSHNPLSFQKTVFETNAKVKEATKNSGLIRDVETVGCVRNSG